MKGGWGGENVVPEAGPTNLKTVNKQVFVCFFSQKKYSRRKIEVVLNVDELFF